MMERLVYATSRRDHPMIGIERGGCHRRARTTPVPAVAGVLPPDTSPMQKSGFMPARRIPMTITGSCHCGKVAFEIDGDLPDTLTRCTCSFCAKRGALVAYFRPDQLRDIGVDGLGSIYRWNTKLVAHHFCATCGCATYSDSPDFQPDGRWDKKTRRLGVNARLFDDYDAAAMPMTVIDGKNLW
jgi:hypothetical protein